MWNKHFQFQTDTVYYVNNHLDLAHLSLHRCTVCVELSEGLVTIGKVILLTRFIEMKAASTLLKDKNILSNR
jgi:hypothetical protein